MTDEYITGHPFEGRPGGHCTKLVPIGTTGEYQQCDGRSGEHAVPGPSTDHLIFSDPHAFVPYPDQRDDRHGCAYSPGGGRICGYPKDEHEEADRARREVLRGNMSSVVRMADVAQYARSPMPDAARLGPVVTLIDAPVDPLGTLAVLGGIYKGEVYRSKSEVTDEQRRSMLEDMRKTALSGPLESIQFTFLVEGVGRDITHQMVRSRFSFFAQESLRFAVADDWAQEVPLPPSLAALPQDAPAVGVWRKALNQAEDAYNALVGAGMAAEEARKVLPHAITTRLFWVMDLRTMLLEAGKRTCTQAQFEWRQIFAGVARALRDRGSEGEYYPSRDGGLPVWQPFLDNWQYKEFAKLMRPMCYQEGACKMMASFDRGCTIRSRVNDFAAAGVPSDQWGELRLTDGEPGKGPLPLLPINPREWAADPAAARVVE